MGWRTKDATGQDERTILDRAGRDGRDWIQTGALLWHVTGFGARIPSTLPLTGVSVTPTPANLKLAGVLHTSLGDSSQVAGVPQTSVDDSSWLENWLPGRGVVALQPGAMVGRCDPPRGRKRGSRAKRTTIRRLRPKKNHWRPDKNQTPAWPCLLG